MPTDQKSERWEVRRVGSSWIAWVGWSTDPGEPWLVVSLKSGRRYLYIGVPRFVCEQMAHAKSPGKFHWQNIRGKYTTMRLHVGP